MEFWQINFIEKQLNQSTNNDWILQEIMTQSTAINYNSMITLMHQKQIPMERLIANGSNMLT